MWNKREKNRTEEKCHVILKSLEDLREKYIKLAISYVEEREIEISKSLICKKFDHHSRYYNNADTSDLISATAYYEQQLLEFKKFVNTHVQFFDADNKEMEEKYGKLFDGKFDFYENPFVVISYSNEAYICEHPYCIIFSNYTKDTDTLRVINTEHLSTRTFDDISKRRVRPMTVEEIRNFVAREGTDVKRVEELVRAYRTSKYLKKND